MVAENITKINIEILQHNISFSYQCGTDNATAIGNIIFKTLIVDTKDT